MRALLVKEISKEFWLTQYIVVLTRFCFRHAVCWGRGRLSGWRGHPGIWRRQSGVGGLRLGQLGRRLRLLTLLHHALVLCRDIYINTWIYQICLHTVLLTSSLLTWTKLHSSPLPTQRPLFVYNIYLVHTAVYCDGLVKHDCVVVRRLVVVLVRLDRLASFGFLLADGCVLKMNN